MAILPVLAVVGKGAASAGRAVWGFLSSLDWKVYALAGLLASGWYYGHIKEKEGLEAGRAEVQALWDAETERERIAKEKADKAAADELAKAIAAARAKEARVAAENQATVDRLVQENKNALTKRDKLISDLHNGYVRLRDRFTCQTSGVPGVPGTASNSDAGTACGLSNQDADFLIREANRADDVARQLNSCQAVVRTYQGAQNGE